MFKKGMKKVPGSGRKKGVSNKPDIQSVKEFLAERDINPLAHLLKLVQGGELKAYEQANIWMFVMSYAYPRPRTMLDENEIEVSIAEKYKDVSSEKLKESIKREETKCSTSKSTSSGIDLTSLSSSTKDKKSLIDVLET